VANVLSSSHTTQNQSVAFSSVAKTNGRDMIETSAKYYMHRRNIFLLQQRLSLEVIHQRLSIDVVIMIQENSLSVIESPIYGIVSLRTLTQHSH